MSGQQPQQGATGNPEGPAHGNGTTTSGCPQNVLEAIYGTGQKDKKAEYEESLKRYCLNGNLCLRVWNSWVA